MTMTNDQGARDWAEVARGIYENCAHIGRGCCFDCFISGARVAFSAGKEAGAKEEHPDSIVLRAWQNIFGTSQLSHAQARLEATKDSVARLTRDLSTAQATAKAQAGEVKRLQDLFSGLVRERQEAMQTAESLCARAQAMEAVVDAAEAYRQLATCYRLRTQPSEALFVRLDTASITLAALSPAQAKEKPKP